MYRFNEFEYPRLVEKYTETEFKTLTSDLIDELTATNLYYHFCLRRVNETEKINNLDIWELHFKSALRLLSSQYSEYLRIENIKIDPMVTDYIERQIRTKNAGTTETTTAGTITETSTNGGTTTTTETPRTIRTTTRNINNTENSTDNLTQSQTLDTNTTETRNTTDTTAGTTSDSTTAANDTREMQRTLPNTTYYTNYGVNTARDSSMPQRLVWTDASTQGERDSKETTTANGSNNTETTATGTITTATTGNPTGTTAETYSGNSTGTETATEEAGGTSTTAAETTGTGSRTGNNSGTNSTESTAAGQTREQYTGRHGQAPQDLLDRAREYILRTNAFEWLCIKLNANFLWEV